jgi:flagellar motility protein MotE (MotC chaperone)
MDSLWDKIKQSLVDSASVAAEKAEYLGKIGRARLDIAETRHAIRDRFADLGGLAYENLQSTSAGSDLGVSEDVKRLQETISSLEDELKAREETLSDLRSDAEDSEESEAA